MDGNVDKNGLGGTPRLGEPNPAGRDRKEDEKGRSKAGKLVPAGQTEMKAWSTAGGILSVPGDLVGRAESGDPEVETFNKLCLQLIHRRLLPRRFWYYRTHRFLNLNGLLHPRRISCGLHGYVNAKYGDWEIFKEVM